MEPKTAASLRKSRKQPQERPAQQPGGHLKMYEEESGFQIDPVVVLVASLVFIASVFVLHIVGGWMKG